MGRARSTEIGLIDKQRLWRNNDWHLWQKAAHCPDISDEVFSDLKEVLMAKKGTAPVNTSNPPDPAVPQATWLMSIYKENNWITLRHYRDIVSKDETRRLWMMEAARRITDGYKSKVLANKMLTIDGERVNGYAFSDEAREWWKNGIEQNLSEDEILHSWKGMATMMAEVTSEEKAE